MIVGGVKEWCPSHMVVLGGPCTQDCESEPLPALDAATPEQRPALLHVLAQYGEAETISDTEVCAAYLACQIQKDAEKARGRPWWQSRHETAEVVLKRMTGASDDACLLAMDRAEDKGLVEYGVSLRTGWLTGKGLALLQSEAMI